MGVALIFLLLLAVVGCIGSARKAAVAGPMAMAWPGIMEQAAAGGAEPATLDAFAEALDAKDFATMAAMWPEVRAAATARIADQEELGDIGPGVAASLLERLEMFAASMAEIAGG